MTGTKRYWAGCMSDIEIRTRDKDGARILDVNGTPLIHDQAFNRADSVNVSALPAGLYFLQVANGGIPAVSKFFKK